MRGGIGTVLLSEDEYWGLLEAVMSARIGAKYGRPRSRMVHDLNDAQRILAKHMPGDSRSAQFVRQKLGGVTEQ